MNIGSGWALLAKQATDATDSWDAAAVATILVAAFTAFLALATWRLAKQTKTSVVLAERAFDAGIRAMLADFTPELALVHGVANRPEVISTGGKIEIRVPLRNVGSGLALLQAPKLQAEGMTRAQKVQSTSLTTAVRAGEFTVMQFTAEFTDDAERLEAVKELHESLRFAVIARCQDMNGEQEIRTEATLLYTPAAEKEGPTYSGRWNFEQVRLFIGDETDAFAELPRSQTISVTGASHLTLTAGSSVSGEVEPGDDANS